MLISEFSDMEVVGEASDGEEALSIAKRLSPDIVLMDITMPGSGGIVATEKIRENCEKTRVVILTMHEDPVYVRSALAAGATGYIAKRAADSELISAIRAVYRGRTFIDSSQAEETVFPSNGKRKHAHGKLSEREYQVLKLLARGYTHQQIAEEILISIKSVETYRSRLTKKLELHSRADLIRYALEM
ncbi:response regulator transcription factor, partial [bacterium]|nr:response regulator transcription factor [bacterium]